MARGSGMSFRERQKGAFLVMMAVLVVVLIGIAALAIDIGRAIALRAEMQNAVDAAALAAAVELDGKTGAQVRARAAARNALIHDSRYARIAELLGETSLPDAAFSFYCIIGSKNDVRPDEVDMSAYCNGSDIGGGFWAAAGDTDSHYVRVHLDPGLVPGRFEMDLIFLPVLGVFGIDTANDLALNATATAGRHFYECNYPPMIICDPFEGTGTTFKQAMVEGRGIVLREQGSGAAWVAGNFGFLKPRDGGPGAGDLAVYLADADLMGCTPSAIETKTGEMAQKTKAAINTRFDEYPPQLPKVPIDDTDPVDDDYDPDGYDPGTDKYTAWPPAPNIGEYPMDQSFLLINGVIDDRFGTGDWDFDGYWAATHPGVTKPNGWSNATNRPTRWDVYSYEATTAGLNPAEPTHTAGSVERRILHVAVASCAALGLKGSSEAVLLDPDGFARMFVIRKADDPNNKLNIYAEYLGWSMEQDAHYHVDIQLYQ